MSNHRLPTYFLSHGGGPWPFIKNPFGAPEELEFLPGAQDKPDMSLIYPVDPKDLPCELAGVEWPPKS